MSKKTSLSADGIHSPWSPAVRAYKRVHPPISGASMTQQEFRDQCDINHQIALFTRAGRPLPVYGTDASVEEVQDLNATYIDAVNSVREVEEAFQQLPWRTRARFDNSPLKLAEYLSSNPDAQEAYDLGLINAPPPTPAPAKPLKAATTPPLEPSSGDVPPDGGTPK